jgi:acyl-CoA dehydrogenase
MVQPAQGGFEAFMQRVGSIIEGLPAALADTGVTLGSALDDCRSAVAHIRAHAEEAPRHARRLLDRMADTLCAALLLEEAAADHDRGDARKAIVARRYLVLRLDPPSQRALAPAEDSAHRHFQALIGYAAVNRNT